MKSDHADAWAASFLALDAFRWAAINEGDARFYGENVVRGITLHRLKTMFDYLRFV